MTSPRRCPARNRAERRFDRTRRLDFGPGPGSGSGSGSGPGAGERGEFAVTWWGREWIRALEDHATDPARLARGRTYARGGYVAGATAKPGRLAAYVRGSRPRPYRADLHLRELTGEEWDAFLDAVSTRPAHIAALLDREMPPTLVEAAEAVGVRLLPGDGEPVLSCSCPDHGAPCKHTAALCYVTARVLDDDPFLLLLLRGRGESEILDELAHRNAVHTARTARLPAVPDATNRHSAAGQTAAPRLATVTARTACATSARPPLPAPLPPPDVPGEAPLLPDAPVRPHGKRADAATARAAAGCEPDVLDPDGLAFLATDAAARAHAFLTGASASPLPRLSSWQDAVRLAATHPRLTGRGTVSRRFAALAAATGGTPDELARAAAAWRQGAEAGLAVLHEPWDPPAGDFDRGRSALAALGLRMTIDRNRLTAGALQLRYGRDGRWYPYRAEGGSDFWPEGPAATDPARAWHGFFAR